MLFLNDIGIRILVNVNKLSDTSSVFSLFLIFLQPLTFSKIFMLFMKQLIKRRESFMGNLQSGDILIFEAGDNWLSKCIAKLTNSNVSHAAMC